MGANVFLSYGHRDAADVAAKLRTELERAGHDVWQDVDGIRVARGWTSQIADALRGSDVVVALLSPHSVRRAIDPANPDAKDSVCIDEIEYAFDGVGIPVVPVMVTTCEVPFRIFRLQYLDFRRWRESAAHFDALLGQLMKVVAAALETGNSPTRVWGYLPEPWDFSAFLADRRTRFTGRDWLFAEIETWRADDASHSMLIVGGPGVGKSAIVAQLVHENPGGQVLAYHCCQADTPTTLRAATFVRSIAGQLSSRVEGYASAFETPRIRDALDVAAVEPDPASAFEAGILAPLGALPAPEGGPKYLLVDALDEALSLDEGMSVLDVLVTRLSRFPPWLRLVATTRPNPGVLRKLRGHKSRVLDAGDRRNLRDVRAFATLRLEEPRFRDALERLGKSRAQTVDLLLEASAGNFLYVAQALEAVGENRLTLAEVLELPPGLGSLYEIFFDRVFEDREVDYASTRTVLEVVLAALEPADRTALAAVTGLDDDYGLARILGRLASFVPARHGRYSVFHASIAEWLTGWDDELDQPITERYHVNPVEGHKRWADHLLRRYDAGDRADPDVVRRLPAHLAESRSWDDLARVLTDWRFLETKVSHPASSVFDLLADYDLASASMPEHHEKVVLLRLLGEILRFDGAFIATHPATLFQCCWNRGYWHDSPVAAEYFQFEPPNGAKPAATLSEFVEEWRMGRGEGATTPWIRFLRPPTERLGTAQRAVFHGHGDSLNVLAVSPDGTRLALEDWDDGACISLRDPASGGHVLTTNFGRAQGVSGFDFTPDGTSLAVAHPNGTVTKLDADTLETRATLEVDEAALTMLAISDDGRRAVVGDWEGSLHLIDVEAWALLHSARVFEGGVADVAFSPCGEWIVAGGPNWPLGQKQVLVCRSDSLGIERAIESQEMVTSVAFAPDGERFVWGDYGGRVHVQQLGSDTEVVLADTPTRNRFGEDEMASIGSLVYLGELLLVGTQPGFGNADILVWDPENREIVHRLGSHQFGVGAIVSIDDVARFASAGDSTVRVWDLSRSSEMNAAAKEPYVGALRFSRATGTVITAAVQSDRAWVTSADDGAVVRSLDGHRQGVHSLEIDPDGSHLVCGAGDGSVRVWDLPTGGLILEDRPHKAAVSAVLFSNDGALIASGSFDETVCVRRLDGTGEPVLLAVDDLASGLAISSAGDRIAVVGLRSLQMWNMDEPSLAWNVEGVRGPFYKMLFFDDGLILQGNRRELYAFDVATGFEQVATAAQNETWMERVGYSNRTWAWRGTYPVGKDPEDGDQHQFMGELLRIDSRQPVVWLPLLLGGVDYFPNRPVWANRRGESAWVFRLEGGDDAAC